MLRDETFITSPIYTYLWINITKVVKHIYKKNNFKSFNKGAEKNPRSWKELPCPYTGRVNIVKMTSWTKDFPDSLHLQSKSSWWYSEK